MSGYNHSMYNDNLSAGNSPEFNIRVAVKDMRDYAWQITTRRSYVEWAAGCGLRVQGIDAVSGRWDNIRLDLRRGRITFDQAMMLLERYCAVGLGDYKWFYTTYQDHFRWDVENREENYETP